MSEHGFLVEETIAGEDCADDFNETSFDEPIGGCEPENLNGSVHSVFSNFDNDCEWDGDTGGVVSIRSDAAPISRKVACLPAPQLHRIAEETHVEPNEKDDTWCLKDGNMGSISATGSAFGSDAVLMRSFGENNRSRSFKDASFRSLADANDFLLADKQEYLRATGGGRIVENDPRFNRSDVGLNKENSWEPDPPSFLLANKKKSLKESPKKDNGFVFGSKNDRSKKMEKNEGNSQKGTADAPEERNLTPPNPQRRIQVLNPAKLAAGVQNAMKKTPTGSPASDVSSDKETPLHSTPTGAKSRLSKKMKDAFGDISAVKPTTPTGAGRSTARLSTRGASNISAANSTVLNINESDVAGALNGNDSIATMLARLEKARKSSKPPRQRISESLRQPTMSSATSTSLRESGLSRLSMDERCLASKLPSLRLDQDNHHSPLHRQTASSNAKRLEPIRESSRASATSSRASERLASRPNSAGSMGTGTRPPSSVTSARSNSSIEDRLISVSTKSLNFGYVEVGESLQQTVAVRNTSSSHMTINTSLRSDKGFQIIGGKMHRIAPGEQCIMTLEFCPTLGARFNNNLRIDLPQHQKRHTVSLRGCGGTALIEVAKQFDRSRSGCYLIDVDTFTHIEIPVTNKGPRTAFVHVALRFGDRDVTTVSTVKPAHSFVISKGQTVKVTAHVPQKVVDSYVLSEMHGSSQSLNSQSSSSVRCNQLSVTLYWAEEELRRRLRMYEQHTGGRECVVDGHSFTHEYHLEDPNWRLDPELPVHRDDMRVFEAGLRRILLVANSRRLRLSMISRLDDSIEDEADRTLVDRTHFSRTVVRDC